MKDKPKVKVVKKHEALALKHKKRATKARPRNSAQEMVTTVTGWVSDVKKRKSEETKTALDLLFSVNPRPSES
jgi:hypothetical protein